MLPDSETAELRPVERPPCAIDVAVGSDHCVQNHQFEVRVQEMGLQGPRLRVSRYYWDIEPPVAVDLVRDLRFGERELAAKKAYFFERNILYVLARDIYDGEGVEATLAEVRAQDKLPAKPKSKPLTGPRPNREETNA